MTRRAAINAWKNQWNNRRTFHNVLEYETIKIHYKCSFRKQVTISFQFELNDNCNIQNSQLEYLWKTLNKTPRLGPPLSSISILKFKTSFYIFISCNRAQMGLFWYGQQHWTQKVKTLHTLRPEQNGHHFAKYILKCNASNEIHCILIKILQIFVHKVIIENKSVLVQAMACTNGDYDVWHHIALLGQNEYQCRETHSLQFLIVIEKQCWRNVTWWPLMKLLY